jgi:hypothetical protein
VAAVIYRQLARRSPQAWVRQVTLQIVSPEPPPGGCAIDLGRQPQQQLKGTYPMATKSDRFPKRFLSAADLKGKPVRLTIKREYTEELQGADGDKKPKSILSFVETNKELVLNVTNFDAICDATGEYDSANWPGWKIILYPTKTQMAGKTVDCIRVRAPDQAAMKLVSPSPPAPAPETKPADKAAGDPDDMDDEIPF